MLNRRAFTSGSLALLGLPRPSFGQARAQIVIVGGGAGGATAARALATYAKGAHDIVLIEPQASYMTCFFSNLYLAGFREAASLQHGYEKLAKDYGIRIVPQSVQAIERAAKTLRLSDGTTLAYDYAILSPGVAFRYQSIPGYSPEVAERLPHAWKAGEPTILLKQQLEAMRDGGRVVIVAPPDPYRCPSAPYERASMMASYFKTRGRGKCRIAILDPKQKFIKQALFQQAWDRHYPGMIEWVGPDRHGGIQALDAKAMTVVTARESFGAALINPIPAQQAAPLMQDAGLTDATGFCPIDAMTMASQADPALFVIGDSAAAGDMPKTAFAANSQAKAAVLALAASLEDREPDRPRYFDSCWSYVAPDDAVVTGASYAARDGHITSGLAFISGIDEDAEKRKSTAREARDWYGTITDEMFG